MVNELLIISGLGVFAASMATVTLYIVFKGNITFKLWFKLIPGLLLFAIISYTYGRFFHGIHNILATMVCLLLGISAMVVNLIFIGRSIFLPINKLIGNLTDVSDQVNTASGQISAASQSLAEGTSEQAAGLEETSSAIEEMTSQTKQNADNANQANTLMVETSRIVDEANHSMRELTESMKEISTASEETAKIIKTIDEIAFQTNLLALNAAVEAARAGEAGAGFAVVADEVRNLAMRAADAAKNTASLIEGTVTKIKNGSHIVAKTNEDFGKVAAGAKKVSELVGEIAAASNEQAQGIDQVNRAVAEMEKTVQQNAASAEESASASEEMGAQAEQMESFVRELAAVIGSQKGNGAISAKGHFHAGLVSHQGATLQPPSKAGIRNVPLTPKRKEKGDGNRKDLGGLHSKITEVRPDEIIPMEEGKLKEF
jgi:methyl-accepting chemotaxis protein